MDHVSLMAAAGLRSRLEALDMLANNLANASTNGYKADREFHSVYAGADAELEMSDPLAARVPVNERRWTDFSQGVLQPTNNGTDLALDGQGFFTIQGKSGPLYTRGGSFQLDNQGRLVTADKYPLLDAGGAPLRVSSTSPFDVDAGGLVRQNGITVGQLAVVRFGDQSVLSKSGGTYFENTDPKVKPVKATDTTVHQGRIEASNVGPAQATVQLVGVMRQFEMLQKAIGISADMGKKAVEDLARVGG